MTVPAGSRVLILHNEVDHRSPADARDVLDQVRHVGEALQALGMATTIQPVDLRLDTASEFLRDWRPDLVFNLVESIGGSDRLAPLATGLLDSLNVAYTGNRTATLVLTSHKILAKRWLVAHGLPTPAWLDGGTTAYSGMPEPWIVKPLWEDASVGIDDDSVVADLSLVPVRLATKRRLHGGEWFAEKFIDGREVSVAMLADEHGPQVLPPAEIEFVDYPETKPRIVGYAAKWHEESFEAVHTPRRFLKDPADTFLRHEVERIAVACWQLFDLRGYARVDFRVDASGQPWILEVNANPCLSLNAGFTAALTKGGITYEEAISRILADAVRDNGTGSTA